MLNAELSQVRENHARTEADQNVFEEPNVAILQFNGTLSSDYRLARLCVCVWVVCVFFVCACMKNLEQKDA
jgi:hypothetical protein